MVGDPWRGAGYSPRGVACVFVHDDGAWVPHQELTTGLGADRFGAAVWVSGNTMLVGAPDDDTLGSNAGVVHFFIREDREWVEIQRLFASDGSGWDFFGSSLSRSRQNILVGAPGDGCDGYRSGSAYVFESELLRTPQGRVSPGP